jgi:hypothetical protein
MKYSRIAFLALSIMATSEADAALLGFEIKDGYTLLNVDPDGDFGVEKATYFGTLGPEVHTYDAGKIVALHTDIVDNTGKFRNIYGAGGKGDLGELGGDSTYLVAHASAQSAGSTKPGGYVAGDQVLALRSENQPFGDPYPGNHNAKYAYTVDDVDLNGTDPNAIGNSIVALSFYTCVSANQTTDGGGLILSTIDNPDFRSLEMGFGGANGDAARIGWTDENNLAYYNGTSWVETAFLFDYKGYDKVSLSIDTLANTWSLAVNRSLNAYATEVVVSNQALTTTVGSSFGDITFTAIEDQDDGIEANKNGLAKTYFDNFAFTVVPEPSSALLGLLGCLGLLRRRR